MPALAALWVAGPLARCPLPPPQARNQQLVRVVRALVRQLQKAGGALGLPEDAASALKAGTPVAAAAALRRMQAELEELRVARERQESIVGTLVQQRDMYRVLLHQGQGGSGAAAGGVSAGSLRDSELSGLQASSSQELLLRSQLVGSPGGAAAGASPAVGRGAASLTHSHTASAAASDGLLQQQQQQAAAAAQAQQQVLALESMLEAGRTELARTREEANGRIADLDAALTGEHRSCALRLCVIPRVQLRALAPLPASALRCQACATSC